MAVIVVLVLEAVGRCYMNARKEKGKFQVCALKFTICTKKCFLLLFFCVCIRVRVHDLDRMMALAHLAVAQGQGRWLRCVLCHANSNGINVFRYRHMYTSCGYERQLCVWMHECFFNG